MQQISAQELYNWIGQTEDLPYLLDVREPPEFAHCRINDSHSMPMRSVPQNLDQLPREQSIITICHHGMRSQQVAQFLTQQGFTKVWNLEGGVDAWAREVEPDMSRY